MMLNSIKHPTCIRTTINYCFHGMNSEKRMHPREAADAFSTGMVTATGERIFIPLRKREKRSNESTEEEKNGIDAYTDVSAIPNLSENDIKLIRMQNRITIEGDDIVGPILKFTNIGLQAPVLKKIVSMGITVLGFQFSLFYRHRSPSRCKASR